MPPSDLTWIANFIWGIADDVPRDLYVRGKYRDVILPMIVLRRLHAVLEPTKQAVLDMRTLLDKAKTSRGRRGTTHGAWAASRSGQPGARFRSRGAEQGLLRRAMPGREAGGQSHLLKRHFWVLALVAALSYTGIDSWVRLGSIWALTQTRIGDLSPPTPDPASPTGYAGGERNLILPSIGVDGFHWIMQTQLSLAGRGSRIRAVEYDNPPGGREVHWSSSFRWWLTTMAWLDHALTGTPLPRAVERVAPFANTVLLGLFMLALIPIAARRLGSTPASLLAMGMVGVQPFYYTFIVGNPDHHGLAAIAGLTTVLFLIGGGAGWVKAAPAPPTPRAAARPDPAGALASWLLPLPQARRWFIASGVAGGAGLWVSAATITPVLIGTGLGALAATGWLARSSGPTDGWRTEPGLWRAWGIAGAMSSLFFYLLEYFPAHLGWRLEVNHPLFAIAWLGGGELLYRACRYLRGERPTETLLDWLAIALGVLGLALLPVVVYLWPARTFLVSDHFLWSLHEDYIGEFKGLVRGTAHLSAGMLLGQLNVLPLLTIPAASVLFRSRAAAPAKALLLLALLPSLATLALAFKQVRWLGLTYGVWMAALASIAMVFALEPALRRTWAKGASAILVAVALFVGPVVTLGTFLQFGQAGLTELEEVLEIVTRDVAHRLRRGLGDTPASVISGPTTTTWLVYYGGFRGVGTLYWENLEGLKTTARIYGAPSPEQAYEAVKRHGVTHLVIFSWDAFAVEYARLSHQLRREQQPPAGAFVLRLLDSTNPLPPWLAEVPFKLPHMAALRGHWVRIYEVRPLEGR
jgi:hypothetical protein